MAPTRGDLLYNGLGMGLASNDVCRYCHPAFFYALYYSPIIPLRLANYPLVAGISSGAQPSTAASDRCKSNFAGVERSVGAMATHIRPGSWKNIVGGKSKSSVPSLKANNQTNGGMALSMHRTFEANPFPECCRSPRVSANGGN